MVFCSSAVFRSVVIFSSCDLASVLSSSFVLRLAAAVCSRSSSSALVVSRELHSLQLFPKLIPRLFTLDSATRSCSFVPCRWCSISCSCDRTLAEEEGIFLCTLHSATVQLVSFPDVRAGKEHLVTIDRFPFHSGM